MVTPDRPRRGVTIPGLLLATFLLPLGAMLAPIGIGIPIFAIGLALIVPE